MRALDQYLSEHKDVRFKVTKLRKIEDDKPTMVPLGSSYYGQATLHYYGGESSGCCLMLDGGFTLRTSLVIDGIQKTTRKWLIKTMNSIYRLEMVE